METHLSKFVERLESLSPSEHEDIVSVLYELTEEIDNEKYVEKVIPNIFEFMERNPLADIGSPGPLVHLVEKFYPNYVEELKASIARKPTIHTIWMLNRILNSNLSESERTSFLQLLFKAQTNKQADQSAREEAKYYYEYQMVNNG